jgi:hypothetical protein
MKAHSRTIPQNPNSNLMPIGGTLKVGFQMPIAAQRWNEPPEPKFQLDANDGTQQKEPPEPKFKLDANDGIQQKEPPEPKVQTNGVAYHWWRHQ